MINNCDFPGYTEENTKDIIVSFYGADGWWEDGGHDASWLWENGKTSGEYYHKTDPNKTVDTVNLVASLWKIHKKNYYNIAGKLLNSEYWSEPTKQFKKTITYDYSSSINQTKYSPYNLNRNGLATTSDISSVWVGNTKLDVTLDNEQGVADNSLLKTLDVNADSNFKFKFNNSTFGMPTNLDWSTKVPTVNGYWDTNSSAYCNGNVSSNSDGYYRYNLTFNASINTIDTNNPTASLVFDNSELLATQQLTKTYQGDGSFRGGDWISRFTYVGEYSLDNESSTKFKDWWINTYNQAKLYEYGTEYKGRITLSGIENPYWNRYGEGSTDGSNYKIHTDTDKGLSAALKDINNVPDKYRGLYIKSSTVSCEQPVVTGKWKVDTIAGTVS